MDVLVLAGGPSAERAISLKSGAAASQALLSRGHRVKLIDPVEVDPGTLSVQDHQLVFIALHGTYGEDGQIQRFLADRGWRYTGSGETASRIAFHKFQTKSLLQKQNLPTPPAIPVFQTDSAKRQVAKQLPFSPPFFVKPEAQGSSLGVSRIDSHDQLDSALELAFEFDSTALIEQAIKGQEWTVAVLDHLVFPPLAITPPQDFYDFQAKYESPLTKYRAETDAEHRVARKLSRLARNVYDTLGARGLIRIDFIVDTTYQPWIIEVNTIPGLTRKSLVPKAAAAIGWDYATLCERICHSAIRHEEKSDWSIRRTAS